MKKSLLMMVFMILASATVSYAAEMYTISRSDVNRLIFPEEIADLVSSEEKGLITKVVGRELYVKLPVQISIDQNTQEKTVNYSELNSELFVIAGGKTYNLILTPSNISSRTIEVEPSKEDIVVVQDAKDEEERLGKLLKIAIEGDYPSSFKVTDVNKKYEVSKGHDILNVVERRQIKAGSYVIKELHIHSKERVNILSAELATYPTIVNPLAVSILSDSFVGWTRAFIVERSR